MNKAEFQYVFIKKTITLLLILQEVLSDLPIKGKYLSQKRKTNPSTFHPSQFCQSANKSLTTVYTVHTSAR